MAARSGLASRIDFSDPHKPDGPCGGWKTCHGALLGVCEKPAGWIAGQMV